MQADIDTLGWAKEVQILGINKVGLESGNAGMCLGRVIPWLQDAPDQMVWEKWNVNLRDVVILDARNVKVATFNLTVYNLLNPTNYDSLKALLSTFANAP